MLINSFEKEIDFEEANMSLKLQIIFPVDKMSWLWGLFESDVNVGGNF